MSILAMAVVAIIMVIVFFGAFTGFVVGDVSEEAIYFYSFALAPAAVIAILMYQFLYVPLWFFSFWIGYQMAQFLNQKEH